jgi:hypothetical protein
MKNPLSKAFRALENFNFRLWTAGGLVSNIGTIHRPLLGEIENQRFTSRLSVVGSLSMWIM